MNIISILNTKFRHKLLALRVLLLPGVLFVFNNCTFEAIHQPDIADPESSFTVSFQMQKWIGHHGENRSSRPFFGVLLPNGWGVDDSLFYQHGGGPGWVRYSIEYSDTMEIIDPAPSGYFWWVGLDTVTSIVPEGRVHSDIEIFTDSQEGTFFIDYMLGPIRNSDGYRLREDASGLNAVRSNDHPISINAPMSLSVTNNLDSGPGSLRQILSEIGVGGTIHFDVLESDSIQLDSQLVVDRSVSILGQTNSDLAIIGGDTSGIMRINSHLDVSISDLTFKNGNNIGKPGGAILTENTGCDLQNGSLTIANSTFLNNHAVDGGGLYVSNTDLTLDSCRIIGNTAQFVGGAIRSGNSNVDISKSVIIHNETTSSFDAYGGAIYLDAGRSRITSTLIAGNTSGAHGGGLFAGHSLDLTLQNATIIDNRAETEDGDNIYVDDYAEISVLNSIIGNSQNEGIAPLLDAREVMTFHHSNLVGTSSINYWAGVNNISSSPFFVDPDSNDYRLQSNSPCINEGAPWSRQDEDGTTADMGAFTTLSFAGTGDYPSGVIGGIHAGVISSDVVLASDLIVPAGSMLSIAPGVVISSIGFTNKIISYGTLEAIGSEQDTIRFIGGPEGWNGIEFMGESASGSHLKYCQISNSRTYGIGCLSSSPRIENSLISHNGLDDESGRGGLYCENSGSLITYTQIIHNENYDWGGGGISAFESSHLTLNSVEISDNYSGSEGGGIYVLNSSIVLEHGLISENESEWNGGGLFSYNASLTLRDCDIFNNDTDVGSGGGISIIHEDWYGWGRNIESSTMEAGFTHLKDVNIDQNSAGYGGGIAIHGLDNVLFEGVSILRNTATEFGGGLDCWYSNPRMINMTLADNSTESGSGAGMSIRRASRPKLINSIVWGSPTQDIMFHDQDTSHFVVAYSDIQDGEELFEFEADAHAVIYWEIGNITINPQFTDPDEGDYEIWNTSPCIDAGVAQYEWDGEILVNLSEDEYVGNAPDIGAVQVGLTVGNSKDIMAPTEFTLSDNFPNPFNTTTTLQYALPLSSEINLEIFDILGRKIATLAKGPHAGGRYTVHWNGKNSAGLNMSTGLYFYRLSAQATESSKMKYTQVRKMVLIK